MKALAFIGRTLLRFLVFALVAAILIMVSDYLWALIFNVPSLKENAFQRIGYYTLFLFVLNIISGVFLVLILSDWLTKERKGLIILYSVGLFIIGVIIGILTQGDGFELYRGPGSRAKHILMMGLVFAVYPFISKWVTTRFLKAKKT